MLFSLSYRFYLASIILLWSLAAPIKAAAVAQTIEYAGTLTSPGGDLRFGLSLEFDGSTLKNAAIVNGPERQSIEEFALKSDELVLRFQHYNSEIKATFSDDRRKLAGTWTKRAGPKLTKMKFHADEWPKQPAESSVGPEKFMGRWQVKFDSSTDPAVGIFEVVGPQVHGTFLTTTGDYRYLAGDVRDGKLQLSTFDGAHAFLFDASLAKDATLTGNFWSGSSWHETWTATQNDDAQLPDDFEQVHLVGDANWSKVLVRDLDGTQKSLADKNLFGELTIINIFGSWCPNCHDEAPYLAELQRQFGSHGLKVIGLAFEASGEFEPDAAQVRRFVKRHLIPYPVFIAGESDKEKASKSLPFVDRIKAFPTSLFVDRSGKVIAIHSGFSGPATGQVHVDLKHRFEQLIRRELDLR